LVELSLRKPKFTSRITVAALQAAFLNAGSGELFIHHALGHHLEGLMNPLKTSGNPARALREIGGSNRGNMTRSKLR
jgi:hypothetical protein